MASAALALYAVFIVTGFGWRSYLQWRRTGSTGMRGFHGRPGSTEWLAGVGFAIAVVAGAVAPILQLVGALTPVGALDHPLFGVAGTILAVLGIAATLWAQESMGDSWRIGVDTGEVTQLVDNGVFGWVRNPIFTAMLVFGAGVALMNPNVLALLGFALLSVSIELQVRVVEEPYLLRTHGARYHEYGRRVGRFIPGVGRFGTDSVEDGRRPDVRSPRR
ncbi:isoprenylcysteine carboxylmethyltransferase family protein [Mycobacterium manitobense]|uniref:Isoprenylcysteine carboxylmethyltransferase family protein n=1 Tax=[Mycobacterium] manitobense TaxID=190147 RepID=A0A9X2Y7T3_9MYCO|nr:isoprenylcysteine carboxylmethyltransferase family protein [[Mycobacterium] manitobense]MCV7169553.1 isoprenylcysteine carboxylmethyltransferase family protein [[Mycobacterium] manitobense]